MTQQMYVTLNNGAVIPQFGLGVYQINGDDATCKACLEAFGIGYRHIDTAHAYQNRLSPNVTAFVLSDNFIILI